MIFKTLTTEQRMKHIKGKEDVLTKEYNKEKEYVERLSCLRCSGKMTSILNSDRPWSQGKMLPNILVKCTECGTEYEPYTALEVKGPERLDELPD